MADYSLIRELRSALDAYGDAHASWEEMAKALMREIEARGIGGAKPDLSDERNLYRMARRAIDHSFRKDAPESGVEGEITQRASRYIMEFDRLSRTLDALSRHLERASEDPTSTDNP